MKTGDSSDKAVSELSCDTFRTINPQKYFGKEQKYIVISGVICVFCPKNCQLYYHFIEKKTESQGVLWNILQII